jgi:hypothetical protein
MQGKLWETGKQSKATQRQSKQSKRWEMGFALIGILIVIFFGRNRHS